MNEKRGLVIILISSLISLITSIYLLYQHYSSESSFCDISKEISCDIVNRSIYSEIFNIPISLLSLLVFYFITIIIISALQDKKIFGLNKKDIFDIVFCVMLFSLLFAFYLFYIEAFVLYAFCPLCILLGVLILINLVTIIQLRKEK